jgi:hypothetical protein
MPGGLYSSSLCRDSGWIQTVYEKYSIIIDNMLYFLINDIFQAVEARNYLNFIILKSTTLKENYKKSLTVFQHGSGNHK